MRIVVALGGNALLRRGEALTAENQRKNARIAAKALAPLSLENELVITHGNGPQVGMLALQGASFTDIEPYPLDILGAETVGMIGYMIEQELVNLLPKDKPVATILTQVEVDPDDPAFDNPTKFIGPVYTKVEAEKLAKKKDWHIRPDGDLWRRVVPSPDPQHIFELRPIKWMIERGAVVIAAGGGGIPTLYNKKGKLKGADCVIDKDLCSCLLAQEIEADVLIMATDANAVFLEWGSPSQKAIQAIHPDALELHHFAVGSMGPKVKAAINFARHIDGNSVICSLHDIPLALEGQKGTTVSVHVDTAKFYSAHKAP
ncbi:carbamate kinase [Flexibacterium corallicola]|uniref:carbamate kinase n=1 Tax=Flexibacterium corallicola TaxID=3037259 RepID=UPI00286F9222|nr:carbamate kinase [Pseudovibrio sp. M1P-2-3]